MPVKIPDDAPIRGKAHAESFDWDEWLVFGQRVEFHMSIDFPGRTMENARQALRNAMGRRGYNGKFDTFKIDSDTFELVWRKNEQLPSQD